MKKLIPFVAVFIIVAGCKKDSIPEPGIIRDIDGNVYNIVRIDNQLWMKENLNTTRYRNGDPIPNITDETAWGALTTGAWCWYNNDSATYAATFGKLYNWFAVNDPRGLAPQAWHVPSDAEWTTLSTFLGGDALAGGAMKETSTTHWISPNTGATNSSGFTGLPGGLRHYDGSFYNIDYFGGWWSSSDGGSLSAWFRYLSSIDGQIIRNNFGKGNGYSVRCIKD